MTRLSPVQWFFVFGIIMAWVGGSIHIWREHELCPFVCRVDANGIKGAWYETEMPTFGHSHTLWISDPQKRLMEPASK